MKKTFFILALFLSLYGIASAATAGQLSYTPLEPFSVWDAKADAYNNFAYYINSIFKLLITLGSLFAVVMLVVAGIGYMVSEAAVDIEKAKQRARAALWGLLLLAGCWLVLYTINPDLLKFNLNIPTNAPGQYTGGSTPGSPSDSGAGSTDSKLSNNQVSSLLDYYKSNPSYLCTFTYCAKSISDSYLSTGMLVTGAESDRITAFNNRCTSSGGTPEFLYNKPENLVPAGTSIYICGQY